MASPVIVVGHRNPDNDSICAAVGYAYLKNEIAKRDGTADKVEYIPARLGPLPPESDPESIRHDASMLEAGRRLRQLNVRSLVVENDDGTFRGLISTRAIAERYISATDALDGDDANPMAVASSLIESLGHRVAEKT